MLRVQRSVETVYSQVNYLAAEMMAGESIRSALDKDKEGIEALAEMAELDAKERAKQPPSALGAENVSHKRKFVAASSSSMGGPQNKMGRHGEEIDIDEEDVEGEENEEPAPISQKPVPLAVFGSAANAAAAAEG